MNKFSLRIFMKNGVTYADMDLVEAESEFDAMHQIMNMLHSNIWVHVHSHLGWMCVRTSEIDHFVVRPTSKNQ